MLPTTPVRSSRLALAAAAAAIALMSAPAARAQYRVGSDGHLNDANSRAGSGGYNSPTDQSSRANLNSQIITGNVSGLNYFHGGTQDFDTNVGQFNTNDRTFQGFTAISAPVNYSQRSTGAANYVPVYNQQSYVGTPPADFVPTKNNVAYIPTTPADPDTPSSDTRIGNLNIAPTDLQGTNIPTRDAADGGGPVNPVGNQQLYSVSPLYGVREIAAGDQQQGNLFMSRYGNNGRATQVDESAIQAMRNQVRDRAADPTGNTKQDGIDGTAGTTGTTPAVAGQTPPHDQVTGGTLASQAVSSAVTGQQVPSSVDTHYSSLQQSFVVPPAQQSKQLADLERRFAAANPKPTADQVNNQNNRLRLAIKKANADKASAAKTTAEKAASLSTPAPTRGGGVGLIAPAPAASGSASARARTESVTPAKPDLTPVVRPPTDAPAASAEPFKITDLSEGIRAPGLKNLLATAQKQMRAGQFGPSVDTYDTAAEVAPNNPFVPLGRGFAELGASYYGKAEADLTHAILEEPAVLAGQYDLKGFLGQDRLAFVQKDLTDIGSSEETARPFLLLAYIAHNTGADDATVTAKDLDTAARRGADTRVVSLMREAWNLKSADDK